jgi:hypothetical protein
MGWPWRRSPEFAAAERPARVRSRDRLADEGAEELRRLMERRVRGELTWDSWLRQFWEVVQRIHLAQFLLATGGPDRMDPAQVRQIEQLLERQLVYLRRFAEAVAAEALTPEELIARGQLYAATSIATYERALAATNGIDLPVYPADFGTPCRANCRCHWEIEEFPDRWEARWITQSDERVCEGCAARRRIYAPFIQWK